MKISDFFHVILRLNILQLMTSMITIKFKEIAKLGEVSGNVYSDRTCFKVLNTT